jgi:hypothetical protein
MTVSKRGASNSVAIYIVAVPCSAPWRFLGAAPTDVIKTATVSSSIIISMGTAIM